MFWVIDNCLKFKLDGFTVLRFYAMKLSVFILLVCFLWLLQIRIYYFYAHRWFIVCLDCFCLLLFYFL